MSFLDRFKIQPKYKSADADVRAQAVAELGAGPLTDDDRAILVALANEDPDPRVRRAAAARIEDVAVLASIAARVKLACCTAGAAIATAGIVSSARTAAKSRIGTP